MADGKPRELFSVRELNDGGLLLTMRGEKTAHLQEGLSDVIQNRWTIHPSTKSINNGTTINCHLQHQDGALKDYAIFINDTKDFLLFPIFCKRCSVLTHPRYDHTPHRKDKVCTITEFWRPDSTLLYTLYIARSDYEFPSVEPYRRSVWRFGNFSFCFYVCFENFPPFDLGVMMRLQSSPVRIGGEMTDAPFSSGFFNVNPIQIASTNWALMDKATEVAIKYIYNHIQHDKDLVEEFNLHHVRYHSLPPTSDLPVLLLERPDVCLGLPRLKPLEQSDPNAST